MLYCKACGINNPEDVSFCQHCGAPLDDASSDLNKTYLVTNILGEYELGNNPWKWGQFLFEENYLLILEIKESNSQFIISPRKRIILGRGPREDNEDNTLIDFQRYGGLGAGVSRQHAEIVCNQHLVTVTDLGSTNGTRINGLKLEPNTPRLLREGDELQLGKLTLHTRFYKPEREKRRMRE